MVRAGRKLTANSACWCTGGCGGQQAELHFARHGDVALELLLLALDRLVEARVFNGDGDLRGQGGERAHVVFVEEAGARVLQIEHADDAVFVEERHDELGARLGIHREIALVLAHVGNIDRTPLAHRRADQPAGDGDAAHGRVRIAEAPCVARDQRLPLFVEQHDGEHLVVDEPAQSWPTFAAADRDRGSRSAQCEISLRTVSVSAWRETRV